MNSFKIKPQFAILSLFFILSLLCTFLTWRIYGQLNNNLAKNSQWTSTKIGLEKSVNGAYEYFYWLQALAYDKLNLGAWYGYQELISQQTIPVHRVEFDYFLLPNSYVDFVYDKNPLSYYSFRISSNPLFPSAVIKLKNTGEYESVHNFDTNSFPYNKWHHLRLDFNYVDNQVTINIDHHPQSSFKFPAKNQPIPIGFRGSHETSYVDNVIIKDAFGTNVFKDNFSFHDRLFIPKIFSIFIFYCLIYLLTRRKPFKAVILLANFLFLLIISTLYLSYYYVAKYPNPNSPWSRLKNILPQPKEEDTLSFSQKMNQEILDSVRTDPRPRILFLGTSQTWGAGAAQVDETYVKVIENLSLSNNKTKYQFINAGISGSSSSEILDFYQKYWLKLNPKIVLVDLSSNDLDPLVFSQNLKKIIDINKPLGITTVFILEANSVSSPQSPPLALHESMRSVAKSENIRLIDINEFLKDQRTAGNLWWDKVHPTTFGHQLLGQYIYQNIKDLLLP
ncbi:MAG: SGNH/GDSL hydrolase family protein [Candidatus Shapirobacteria bacterium]|jgi:lysophospholipase L1-like esterase